MTASLDYDRLAAEYARNRRVHSEVLSQLVRHVHERGARQLLEVGCGTGNYAAALPSLTGRPCWGLDPSAQMLLAVRGEGSGDRLRARAEALPVADAQLDLVFSVDVIHHLADTLAYFRDGHRVLRPGGWLCTVTDSEEIIRNRSPLSVYFPETVDVELARYPSLGRLRHEMALAGFTDLRVVEVRHSYLLTDIAPYRDRAYSALHLISDSAFARGLARLERDLARGPVQATSNYVMLWGCHSCPGG